MGQFTWWYNVPNMFLFLNNFTSQFRTKLCVHESQESSLHKKSPGLDDWTLQIKHRQNAYQKYKLDAYFDAECDSHDLLFIFDHNIEYFTVNFIRLFCCSYFIIPYYSLSYGVCKYKISNKKFEGLLLINF